MELLISIIYYDDMFLTFYTARRFFYYTAIVLFTDTLFRFSLEKVSKILSAIKVVTVITSITYIITYGFGVKLYYFMQEYATFQAEIVFRTVYAYPYFAFFIYASILIKRKLKISDFVIIVLILVSSFLTYSRSLIGIYIFLSVFIMFFKPFREPGAGLSIFRKWLSALKIVKNQIVVIVLGILLLTLVPQMFPFQFGYFVSRIEKMYDITSIIEDRNMDIRSDIISSRIEIAIENNPFFGIGFLNPKIGYKYYPNLTIRDVDTPGTIIVGDQSWGNLIASLGFIGLLIYISMLLYPVILILKTKGLNNYAYAAGFSIIAIMLDFYFSNAMLKEITLISFYISLTIYFSTYAYSSKIMKNP